MSRSSLNTGSLARVMPFVWPYRRRMVVSFVVAVLVAVLWGLNLSVAFPVVKVLLEGQPLAVYVSAEINKAETERAHTTQMLGRITKRLNEVEQLDSEAAHTEALILYKDQARLESRLSSSGRQLFGLTLVRSYVLPWLPGDQFDLLAGLFALLIVATLLKGFFIFVQDVIVGGVIERVVMDLRKAAFRRTLALDFQTVSHNGTPELMSRFTNDMNMLAYGLQLLGGKVVREPLKAVACLVGAMYVSWQLTLLSLISAPIAGVVFYRIGRKLKAASVRSLESMSRIYKTLEETFDAFKVVIAFNAGARHRRRFHLENKEYYRKAMKIVRIDALTSPATEILGMAAAFGALLPGMYLVLRNTDRILGVKLAAAPMDIAELMLLYVFLAGAIDPLRKLSSVYGKVKRSTAAADRIFELLDREPLVREAADPQPLPRHNREIAFRRVEFAYLCPDAAAKPRIVLDDVDLTVAAGEVVAVVGSNGSGKSTLVNLLPRFYDPSHGGVQIDGRDLKDVSLADLRGQIGVVTQETVLFDDTIEENIRYGRPRCTAEQVHAAAVQARVMEFVAEMPDGLQSRVGEKGRRLSGGQRQRVALARAILRDPSILILDEATSAIDATSEQLIHEALKDFCRGRTVFLITHAMTRTLLDFVTKVAVMEQGKLVAYGPHEQVYETCGVYRQLYQSQIDVRGGQPAPAKSVAKAKAVSAGKAAPAGQAWDDDGGPTADDLAPVRRPGRSEAA